MKLGLFVFLNIHHKSDIKQLNLAAIPVLFSIEVKSVCVLKDGQAGVIA
jgi:hypothetical protein